MNNNSSLSWFTICYYTICYYMVIMKRSIIISYGSYQYSYQYSYQLKFPISWEDTPSYHHVLPFSGIFPWKITPPHDFGSSRNSPSKAQLPRAWCSFSASSAFARRKSALGCSGSCQRLGIDLAAAMGVKNGLRLAKVRIHIFLKTLFITFILKNKTPTTYYRQSIYIYNCKYIYIYIIYIYISILWGSCFDRGGMFQEVEIWPMRIRCIGKVAEWA